MSDLFNSNFFFGLVFGYLIFKMINLPTDSSVTKKVVIEDRVHDIDMRLIRNETAVEQIIKRLNKGS